MFEIKNATCGYDKTIVVRDVSLHVNEGEIVALLGRNGVGKTTLLKYAIGLVRSFGGSVHLNHQKLSKDTAARVRAGVGYVPQGRYLFPRLTVVENILVPVYALGTDPNSAIKRIFQLFPILEEKADALAGGLSGGQQQILAIARALTTNPKILILDEPTEGVQPSIIDRILEVLESLIKDQKIAILIAEQNLDFCLALAKRAYLMDRGTIVQEAKKDSLINDTELVQRLLAV